MSDFEAPNTGNYAVGKGIVHFTPEGGTRRDVGNAVSFEVELSIEELEHFSQREGVRTKDLTIALEKSGTLRMVLDEWTRENVALALLGDVETGTGGNATINIFSQNLIRGRVEFTATNEVGPRWDFDFPRVAFRPSGAISPISDEWGQLELEGDVEAVGGNFGTATLQDSTEPATEEPTA